jgi:hypothetical protein
MNVPTIMKQKSESQATILPCFLKTIDMTRIKDNKKIKNIERKVFCMICSY